MAKTRIQKEKALKEISEVLTRAKSMVFTGFNKLTVGEMTAARKTMRAAGVKFLSVKKTLLAKAFEDSKLGALPILSGQVALAYAEDSLAPAREVHQTGKKLEGKLSILGGVFEGTLKDSAGMFLIATIPSRQVLLAQLANLLNSPIQRFVVALSKVAEKKST